MPRIPAVRDINLVQASGQQGVARFDTTGAAEGLRVAAGVIREQLDTRTRYQESKAEADFLVAMEETERSLRNDEDYSTYQERYEQTLNERLGELSSSISDPALRENFFNRQRVNIARGATRVSEMAWGRERDTERRAVEDRLESMRAAAIDTGDWDNYVDVTHRMVEDAISAGYFDQEEGGEVLRRWTDDAAVGYIDTLDPTRQIEILSDETGPAANLQPDVRSRLLEDARNRYSDAQAQSIVDGYIHDDADLFEAMRRASQIKDDVLRAKVENRYQVQYGRYRQAVADEQADLFNEYFPKLRAGEMTVDEMRAQHPAVFDKLTGSQVNSLYQAEAVSVVDTKFSDQAVLDRLYVYEARGDWRAARAFLMDNATNLTRDDYDKWSKATAQAEAPPEIKSILTAQGQVREAARESGIKNDQDISQLTNEIDRWYQDYQRRNGGKEPDATDVRNYTDFMLRRIKLAGPGWNNRFMFDVESAGIEGVDAAMMSDVRDWFLQTHGYEPTPDDILEQIKSLSEK